MVKNPAANAGDVREEGPIPGWERSPGGGNGPPAVFCLGISRTEKPGGYSPQGCKELDMAEAT